MSEKITLCGDNCLECPRYLAKTDEELSHTAMLWHEIGWRDRVVSNDEIRCEGCSSHKSCTYGLVDCTKAHGVSKCNKCESFPCKKIEEMLKRSDEYERKCEKICAEKDFNQLKAAFFNKRENLRK